MTSRIFRVWQPGNPKNRVFLPNFWMKLVAPKKDEILPPNYVKFEIPLEMSSLEVAEYLRKVYKVPVQDVGTFVEQGKMIRAPPFDYDAPSRTAGIHGRVVDKEPDKKFAYVILKRGLKFEFPKLFPEKPEVTKEIQRQQKAANERMDIQYRDWHRPNETWFGI